MVIIGAFLASYIVHDGGSKRNDDYKIVSYSTVSKEIFIVSEEFHIR